MSKQFRAWKLSPENTGTLQRVEFPGLPGTLDEHTRLLPQGGYTTLRTYGGDKVLLLGDHFRRLEETARLAGNPLQLDRPMIRMGLRQAVYDFPALEKRVRIVLDMIQAPGTIYFILEELSTPEPKDYRYGVKAVTRKMQRVNPKAKLTSFISLAAEVRQTIPPDVNEALMVGEDGQVLEGLSSNFFGIQNGMIRTAGEGILNGITRSMVIKVIAETGYPLQMKAVLETELPALEEVFITSASRSVLPVTEIDGKMVGNGRPGEITRAVGEAFTQALNLHLEPL